MGSFGPANQETEPSTCLSDNEKIDPALAALDGMHAVRMVLLEATRPATTISNPAMNMVVDSLIFFG